MPMGKRANLAMTMFGALVIIGLGHPFQGVAPQVGPPAPLLAPYVPTPTDVVVRMLELAAVTKRDVVFDLGCGDGRIAITAARRFGARAVGIEMDPALIQLSQQKAAAAGVEHLVAFKLQNALTADVTAATVVTLYLSQDSNLQLRPILTKQLRPGARIVSHQFDMGDWRPLKTERFTSKAGYTRTLYLWKADGIVR